MELSPAAGEPADVQDWGSRVVRPRYWPLEPLAALQACVTDAGMCRRQGGDLVHDLSRVAVIPSGVRAPGSAALDREQAAGQRGQHPPIGPGLAGRRHGGADELHPPLGVRERPRFLRERRSRQQNVGVGGGLRWKDLLEDEELTRRQAAAGVVQVRVR